MEAASRELADRRRFKRMSGNRTIVRAAWLDQGFLKMGRARLIDVSEGGVALELPDVPNVDSVLRFQCEKFQLYGSGSVKYIGGETGRCVVGVQFTGGSFWRA
ncbi:MAG: PilZ domain-containing protein [Bryobacteraceae bacterium]